MAAVDNNRRALLPNQPRVIIGKVRVRELYSQCHFDMGDTIFQKFIRNLNKSRLLIKTAGINLCLNRDAVCTKLFLGNSDALLYQSAGKSLMSSDGYHTTNRSILESHMGGKTRKYACMPSASSSHR